MIRPKEEDGKEEDRNKEGTEEGFGRIIVIVLHGSKTAPTAIAAN